MKTTSDTVMQLKLGTKIKMLSEENNSCSYMP